MCILIRFFFVYLYLPVCKPLGHITGSCWTIQTAQPTHEQWGTVCKPAGSHSQLPTVKGKGAKKKKKKTENKQTLYLRIGPLTSSHPVQGYGFCMVLDYVRTF